MNIYTGNSEDRFIVDADRYKGFKYIIISLGTHPCCYIEIPHDNQLFSKNYNELNFISCHGGLTYADHVLLPLDVKNSWFIGWDYAHSGDAEYFKSCCCCSGKFWTLEEITTEAKNVINQIIENDPERSKKNEITWNT